MEDVKQNSIRNRDWNAADWGKCTREQSVATSITNKETFYHLVRTALRNLNDHHSFLMNNDKPSNQIKTNLTQKNSVRVENGIGIITIPDNMHDEVDETPQNLLKL